MAKLPVFQQHGDCTDCSLSSLGQSCVGMPTRPHDGDKGGKRKPTAVLFVGAYPGVAEDKKGVSFIGATGRHLHETYINALEIPKFADVYITNAVRCCPRDGVTVTDSHVQRCRQWLEEDVRFMLRIHKQIVLVACGAEARASVMQRQTSLSGFPQGTKITLGESSCVIFSTDLPAVLLPGRDPSRLNAIFEHLLMVRRFLETGKLHEPVSLPSPETLITGDDPPPNVGLVSLDVETYGAVHGLPVQTVYHPRKSEVIDGVRTNDLVRTVSLSWRTGSGDIRHRVYRVQRLRERLRLLAALKGIDNLTILGQNVPFDVLYLRAFDKRFKEVLSVDRCTLYDLMCVSFLENDQRVERSLKNISVVQGIDDYYGEEISLKKGERYDGDDDPRLWTYNARDTLDTLLAYELFVERIPVKYGSDSSKWSVRSREWYNQALWTCIDMAENGIRYDFRRLRDRRRKYQRVMDWLVQRAQENWELPICGKGSGKAIPALLADLVQRYTPTNKRDREDFLDRVVYTDKRKDVSTNQKNVNLLMGVVPPECDDRNKLRVISKYRKLEKVVSSYMVPMLGERTVDQEGWESQLCAGVAYPSWHVVPSRVNDNAANDKEGGTKQGRWIGRNPAIQTQPPVIEHRQKSRWPGGAMIHGDESQIELRVPASMSGDKRMLEVFRKGISLHAKSASMLCGFEVNKKEHPKEYLGGKTANFLRLFGGGAFKLQTTLLEDLALVLPREQCEAFLAADRREYVRMYEWQKELIEQAQANGYIELPLVGISRTFLGDAERNYRSEILNFPVQTIAAWITQSAQMQVWRELRAQKARTVMCSNTYDEMILDAPADEVQQVSDLVTRVMKNPPIWQELLAAGLHEVPLDVSIEVRYT